MRILVLSLILFAATNLCAQDRFINGKIFAGTEDSVLAGATISIKGSKTAVVADSEGAFKVKVNGTNPVLVVEHMGYKKTEVPVESKSTINVFLDANPSVLNEVIVTGYGQQTRRTLTSAITSVSSKEIANLPQPNPSSLLQGRASGVQVNNNSGTPGGGVFVRIRGTQSITAGNEPLYVLDGIPLQSDNLSGIGLGGSVTSPLADINPADIESMEVLKDASATAIYGARAANGVVLITTKKGANKKAKISAGYYYGDQEATKLPAVVDGPTFAMLQNEAATNNGTPIPYPDPSSAMNTDWTQFVFQNAKIRNADISVAGGSEKVKYYISANDFRQEGILKNSDYDRRTLRANIDFSATSKLRIGTNVLFSRNNRGRLRNDDNISGGLEGAFFFPHNLPVYQPDGTYTKFGTFENPIAAVDHSKISMTTNRVLSTTYAEIDIIKGLKFRANFSVDYSNVQEDLYDDTWTNAGFSVNGSAQSIALNNINWNQENYFTYTKNISNHSFNLVAGISAQESKTNSTRATGTQFPSNEFRTISSAAVQTASTTGSSWGLASVFGRLTYDYDNKYLATLTFRHDGSSRFGKDNQYGDFPSAAIGWVLTEEKFMQGIPAISNLKIRASYGLTGNQNIADFAARGLWSGAAAYAALAGTTPSQLANPELKWETTKQADIGIDIGLFNDRLTFTADYYHKKTEDLLLQVPTPRSTGFESIYQNFGSLENKGWELAVTADIFRNPAGLNWTFNANISGNKNKILKLASPFVVYNRDLYRYEEGGEMYSFYLHEQTGVDPKTGSPTWADVNGDGKFDPNVDRKIVGTANPKFYGGITNTLNYKNFDLMFFFQYSYGNKQLNWNRFFLEHGGTRATNYSNSQLDRWQKEGDITMIPKMNAANYASDLRPSRFLEDGSYMRLKNISLGYSIPQKLLKKINVSMLRIYVSAQNLITITNYTGLDPELTGTAATALTQGIEFFSMPSPRTIMGGVTITL
ncbi:SusC/RagA family TonB-linked outer membrane protein [Flavitalea sp.]|nr:TonB-dependent receptor [Flavitalea sp.]